MVRGTATFFSNLIGSVAVTLVISVFLGSSGIAARHLSKKRTWKFYLIAGILGGLFGIYGNISGIELNGAVISIRDIGPMMAGLFGGPVSGLFAGVICGLHRLSMGGITAYACIVATCLIGILCGLLSHFQKAIQKKPLWPFLIGCGMECMHLGIVLLMVKPFETAWGIVRQIALPFVFVNGLGLMLMISVMLYTENHRNLEIERSRLHSELEVANVIQRSLLPEITDTYPGCEGVDICASMDAAKEVGGDFYDVFFVDNRHLAFLVGDVSGKGVPAALFMASAKTILQNCIRDISKLSTAVEVANSVICSKNEAELFITLWAGVLDVDSGEVVYVNAGHNPPILVHAGGAQYLKTRSGFVIGGMSDITYREYTFTLKSGDGLFLYTDGITEAETQENALFGEERLIQCVQADTSADAAQVVESVKQHVSAFVNGNSQSDDMTMMCIKWHDHEE